MRNVTELVTMWKVSTVATLRLWALVTLPLAFGNTVNFIVMWIQKYESLPISKKLISPSNQQIHILMDLLKAEWIRQTRMVEFHSATKH